MYPYFLLQSARAIGLAYLFSRVFTFPSSSPKYALLHIFTNKPVSTTPAIDFSCIFRFFSDDGDRIPKSTSSTKLPLSVTTGLFHVTNRYLKSNNQTKR